MDKKVLGLAAGPELSVRKAGAILAVASLAVVVGNELCQRLVARSIIDNQLLFGYLSDLFAVPFTVGLTNAFGLGRFYWFRPIVFGILFSLLEFEGVFDPWDFDYQVTQLEEGRALDGSFFGRAYTSMPWVDALTQKSEWMSNCIPLVLAGVEEKAKKEEALEDRREADRRRAVASRKKIVKPVRITSPAQLVQYDKREVG
ncbi:MAG: hypothetical protein ACKVHR_01920 [Pirellulales bacterium]